MRGRVRCCPQRAMSRDVKDEALYRLAEGLPGQCPECGAAIQFVEVNHYTAYHDIFDGAVMALFDADCEDDDCRRSLACISCDWSLDVVLGSEVGGDPNMVVPSPLADAEDEV